MGNSVTYPIFKRILGYTMINNFTSSVSAWLLTLKYTY